MLSRFKEIASLLPDKSSIEYTAKDNSLVISLPNGCKYIFNVENHDRIEEIFQKLKKKLDKSP